MNEEKKYILTEDKRKYKWEFIGLIWMVYFFSWSMIINLLVLMFTKLNQPLDLFSFEYGTPLFMAYFFMSCILLLFAFSYQLDKDNYEIVKVKKEVYLKIEK